MLSITFTMWLMIGVLILGVGCSLYSNKINCVTDALQQNPDEEKLAQQLNDTCGYIIEKYEANGEMKTLVARKGILTETEEAAAAG